MKKITFKVSTKKEGSVVSLIKGVNKIPCRIQIDLENGFVAVENVADTTIDSVIELIDQYYTILKVMIDNTSDESTLVETFQSVTVVDKPKSEVDVEETATKNKPTVVSPQSEDEIAVIKTDATVSEKTAETTSEEDVTEGDDTESNPVDADNSDVTTTESKPKKVAKKVCGRESALLDIIGESLKKLDPTKKVEEQIDDFLADIGMTTSERMITQSFVVACDIKKINYENVILELHNMFPKVKEDIIKSILKENFKKWLDLHPELVESCPKISLMAVLRVFAKRFA